MSNTKLPDEYYLENVAGYNIEGIKIGLKALFKIISMKEIRDTDLNLLYIVFRTREHKLLAHKILIYALDNLPRSYTKSQKLLDLENLFIAFLYEAGFIK